MGRSKITKRTRKALGPDEDTLNTGLSEPD